MHDKMFGNRLKSLRKIAGLTQEGIARTLNIKIRTYQNHEAGQWPNRRTQEKYISFFKCDRGWFFTGDGMPYKDVIVEKIFKPGRSELLEGEGPWGKTRHREVEGDHLTITEFKPADGQAQGPLRAAMEGLGEILESNDPILIPAIQANIRAFQLSARRERHNAQQAHQIVQQSNEIKALKERLDTLEKKLKDNPPHIHEEVPTKQKAI